MEYKSNTQNVLYYCGDNIKKTLFAALVGCKVSDLCIPKGRPLIQKGSETDVKWTFRRFIPQNVQIQNKTLPTGVKDICSCHFKTHWLKNNNELPLTEWFQEVDTASPKEITTKD